MPFDWKEYLLLAEYLKTASDGFQSEAALRCAVSRAYYAAFCHARNYARDRRHFEPKGSADDHSAVRRHFQQSTFKNVASYLGDLQTWREICDYRDEIENVGLLANSALDRATKIFRTLK